VEGRPARVTSSPLLTRIPAPRRHRVGFKHASTRYTRVTTLSGLAPPDAEYAHNDFGRRTSHMRPDESPNGHAHCLHLLLGASSSIPVLDGALQLGEWQRIFLVELDGPRSRRDVIVGMTGVLRPSTWQLR
jgi:thiamine phosphate synthase YjbQ (UPF0047 family)